MLRPSRRLTAAAGLAVILAMATPALASAHGSATLSHSAQNGSATSVTSAVTHRAPAFIPSSSFFPSATSAVVGSVGFIDTEQVGYFWSAARGDSVAETLSGPGSVKKAILRLDVTSNNLAAGAHVDWTVSINGKDVGRFTVVAGHLGPQKASFKFAKISGGSYAVKMRVTNEVASGEGSIALRYAGTGVHTIQLKKK